jgi:hypothetical protein
LAHYSGQFRQFYLISLNHILSNFKNFQGRLHLTNKHQNLFSRFGVFIRLPSIDSRSKIGAHMTTPKMIPLRPTLSLRFAEKKACVSAVLSFPTTYICNRTLPLFTILSLTFIITYRCFHSCEGELAPSSSRGSRSSTKFPTWPERKYLSCLLRKDGQPGKPVILRLYYLFYAVSNTGCIYQYPICSTHTQSHSSSRYSPSRDSS